MYGKRPLTAQPSSCVPSCNLHSGLNQTCEACHRPVGAVPLKSVSQHTYHLPLLPLTGEQGLLPCLEHSKREACHMLCLQFPSQLNIPKWNCGLLIEVSITIWAKSFHSPPQITCLREKVPLPYAMYPLGGVHPKSSRWWLSRINVHFSKTIVSVSFAISTLELSIFDGENRCA